MPKMLVTGASGFLGLPIVRELVKQGEYEVYAASSGRRAVDFPDGVIRMDANLLDREQARSVIETVRPDVMLHLAWELSEPNYLNAPSNLDWLEASLFLLRTFLDAGGQYFAFAGSSAEYGHFTGFSEAETPTRMTLYGQSKLAFHQAAAMASRSGNMDYVNLRFFPILGSGVRENIAVARAVAAFSVGEPFVCKAPHNVWDFIAVQDAARAACAVVRRGHTGVVNISGGKPRVMGDVFRAVARKMACEELLTLEENDSRCEILVADTQILIREIGFRCSVGFDEMLDQTIASVRRRRVSRAGA
jgi:nucleoside-diphosphate-sugar epimerase